MKKNRIFFIVALILFILVAVDIFRWMVILQSASSFDQATAQFFGAFPKPMQSAGLIAFLEIVFLIVASVLFSKARKEKGLKVISVIFFVLSRVLIAWEVFTML
jgi:hypothetical protein